MNFLWKRARFMPVQEKDKGRLSEWVRRLFYENLYYIKRDRLERELFHSCVLLKNLAIVHQELPMSTDFLLEQLMEASKPLRNTYADVLDLYRKGETVSAFRILHQRVPTKAALDFSRILSKLDYIQPSELVMQMNGF